MPESHTERNIAMKNHITAALVIAATLTFTVSAHDISEADTFTVTNEAPDARIHISSEASASLMDDIYSDGIQKLIAGINARQDVIEFNSNDFLFVSSDVDFDQNGDFSAGQFADIYFRLVDKHPEWFYVDDYKHFSVSYTDFSNGLYSINSISPIYKMTASETETAKEEFRNITDEIAEYVSENANSDLEKAILLHDYIVLNYEYDRTLEIHDAYRFLTEGKGVCESYSKLYRYVLGLCDVKALYSSSDTMSHTWNIIQIDGKWYHADITWDDPIPDTDGGIVYTNFLIGDEDFGRTDLFANPHTDFINEDGVISEETYSDAFWGHMATTDANGYVFSDNAPIVFDDDNFYYTSYNKSTYTSAVTALSKKDGTTRNVVTFTEKWSPYGNTSSFYAVNFSGLSLINDVLLYSTPTQIRYVLPNGTHDTLIEELPSNAAGYIYHFGTSIDGEFYHHEPFYTHIDPINTDKKDDSKYSRHYKDGKDMYHIEIDCFVATHPSVESAEEWDVDVHIAFNDIHNVVEDVIRKPTFITSGKKEKHCTGCHIADETIITGPYCKEGEDGHEPNVEDLVNIIRCVIGTGSHSGDKDTDHSRNDIDNDGTLSLHDINEIFKVLREEAMEK